MSGKSKKLVPIVGIAIVLSGCVVDQGKTVIDLKRKITESSKDNNSSTQTFNASVSSVHVINNQLVINGSGLNSVSQVKINGVAFNEAFTIESKSTTQIIANSIRNFSFDVSKVLNLILSDASASATFAIDFSLCNASLNGKGFSCAIAPNDKDVLSFDSATQKWKPRAVNGLTYQGSWDATTAEPVGADSGDYYIVNVAHNSFQVGDWIVWNGSSFDQISNSTVITSVYGRTGAVTAQKGDYDLNKLFDVDLTVPPTIGKVLKYDGSKWIAGDDLSGGGAGSVTSAEIANGAVTDAKIDTISASKITGSITSSQIADGTIVNADVSASAAIDYSKLNIPAGSIPYAKLNIANGDIPAAKISGLPSATAVLSTTITDGDTTHAPDGNAVFDALATKLNLTGGTLNVGTISGVPTPTNSDDVANKGYVDSSITTLNTTVSGKVAKAGDTMSGDLSLDTQLKMKGGSNYVTVKANASSAAWTMTLPAGAGTNGYVLSTNGSGVLSWVDPGTTTAGSGTVTSAAIVDGTIVDADISATAAIAQSKISGLATSLSGKEPTITAGTATQYYRGDKTFVTLDTDAVAENTNLYFTNSRVLGVPLTSLNTGAGGAITAADSVLSAFGKLQYQVTDLKAAGQWVKTGSDISYSAGNVEIETKLRLKDSASNYVELKAPSTVTATYTLTFPPTAGSANQVLKTNGSGVLSWVDVADTSVQAFAKSALPTCAAGEVLKSNGTAFTCVTDNTGAGAFTGTASRAVATDSGGALTSSAVTSTELGYVSGVTSAIQTQLNAKEATITAGTTAQYYRGDKSWQTLNTTAVAEGTNLYFTTARAQSAAVADSIADAVTNVAPSQNAVFDALATKLNTTGGTLTVGTINGVPTPTNSDDIVNKDYVDSAITTANAAGKVAKAGDTMTGDLSLDTQLKMKGGSNYVTVKASAATAVWTMTLPAGAGTNGYVLATNGSGVLSWVDPATTSAGSGTVNSAAIVDGTIVDADISATAAISQSKISGLTTALSGKEGSVTAGTTTQYYRGDKTWQTLDTSVVTENSNLYFTDARARSATVADAIADAVTNIAPSQNAVFDALAGKLNTTGGTLSVGTINGVPTPTNADDVVNKAYVDSFGQWTKSGSDLYRSGGNVSIGGSTFDGKLNVFVSGQKGVGISGNTSSFVSPDLYIVRTSSTDATIGAAPSIQFDDNTTNNNVMLQNGLGNFQIANHGDGFWRERLRVAKNGNVGIANANPQSTLDVDGTMLVSSTIGNFARVHARGNSYGNAAALTVSSDRSADGGVTLIRGVADFNADEGGQIEVFKIDNNGSARFGQIVLNSEYDAFSFPDPGGANAGMYGGITGDDGGYKKLTLFHKNAIAFETDANSRDVTKTRMYITQAGSVGIGTTNPSELLEVSGNVKATSFLYTSDRRLKSHIDPIDDALAKILRLRGVEFNWKKDGKREVGLIAQEVEEVEPLLVTTSKESGYKSVKYGNIVALLIEAMKTEHAEVEKNLQMMITMQSQIMENTREIASLKAENKMLKAYLCHKDPEAPFCHK